MASTLVRSPTPLIIAVASSALAMTVGLLAAYALSRALLKAGVPRSLGLMTVKDGPATVVALPSL